MLQNLKFSRIRNSEFIQFIVDFIAILLKFNPKELGIEEQLNPVETELKKMEELQGANRGSDISKELGEIDTRRDNCIDGILGIAEAYLLHFNQEFREAASLIVNKINNYGTAIARQNYPTETASINGITAAFSSEPALQNALTKLHLTEWAAKLKEENDFFNQRFLDRVDETSKKSDLKTKELRKNITDNYNTLRNHLNSHSTLNATTFKPIMDQLNELIDKYNGMVNRRSGGKTQAEE